MEHIIAQILDLLRAGRPVDDKTVAKLIHAERRARKGAGDSPDLAKRQLLPFYLRTKEGNPKLWATWGIDADPDLERRLIAALRIKPRRTASGVATITVITKPWPCSGDCLFCPNDLRMPKSYLHTEPACARAEQNCFDPYLQVSSRLTALSQMGHAVDKIELIVLGGTWSDYPQAYQIWFVRELFRALNDHAVAGVEANPMLTGAADKAGRANAAATLENVPSAALPPQVAARRKQYRQAGIKTNEAQLADGVKAEQDQIARNAGGRPGAYNRAVRALYGKGSAWEAVAAWQTATMPELEREQKINETARCRVVGLVVETRPDAVTPQALTLIRQLGATKIQMGIQSVDQHLLDINDRRIDLAQIEASFTWARLFGFKVHAHFMLNLLGATPSSDKADYLRFIGEKPFQPDEVKLYPCSLIETSRLSRNYADGTWRPYAEDELLDVLADDILATPAFCRVSRMIRDFSSNDIVAGNKKPNLRQLVEARIAQGGGEQNGEKVAGDPQAPAPSVQEIRYREISTDHVDLAKLTLDCVPYETAATQERFLQWVTPENKIAGFLRLSLPDQAFVRAHADELPIAPGEAMIREVHVYGMAAQVGASGAHAQHQGLGHKLIERACELAKQAGYQRINVISSVGTREYYRRQGFLDHGLYLRKDL